MDPALAVALALLAGLALGCIVGAIIARLACRARIADAAAAHSAQLASTTATVAALREQVTSQNEQYGELLDRQRRDQLADTDRRQRESTVLQALTPVQEQLRTMQRAVAELESQRSLQHGQLSEQLRVAGESEERLRATTESLASALRNNATRGVWGETQLRNVVQAAGLIERVDFDLQQQISSDAGAGRPDMVIHLPGGKNLAVDAKVPFSAYLAASQIAVTATGEEGARREQFLREHVKAVRSHIDTLGSKAYWAGLDASPELVIAFIPSESLVASAMEADPGIMDYAFSKRVALSSPVTLWSVLKTVAFSWQQEVVTQEAKMLFDTSRELYGRLVAMAGHIDKLGRSLESSVKNYNGFVGSLERQVLPSARRLNVLDESKVLGGHAQIAETRRDLSAYELVAELDVPVPIEPSRAGEN